ncbi:TPA: hypothetical protein ACKP2V_000183 [Pseudomonas putida]
MVHEIFISEMLLPHHLNSLRLVMRLLSAFVFAQCLLLSTVCRADQTTALIQTYAASRNLPIIDAVREFIHENTDHGDGVWNKKYGNNNAYVLDNMFRTAMKDPKAERPELLCGNRSTAMQAILDKLGIRSRTIYLYSNYSGVFMGHVFVEVMNPVTGSWEIQDADYNVAYENDTGRRLNISRLIAAPDFSKIIPVNSKARGWEAVGVERLMIGQFFNVAYSPSAGMLFYNQQALDTGVVAKVEEYIRENFGRVNYTPARIGEYIMRPILEFNGGVYKSQLKSLSSANLNRNQLMGAHNRIAEAFSDQYFGASAL